MSAFEKEKEKNRPNQVELSSQDAKNNQEQTKSRVETQSTSDKRSPATKSASSDIDRRKFFQSLLQSKNGPKLEATVPNTIPEENESEANFPSRGETPAGSEDSTSVVETGVRTDNIHSECNGNEDEKLGHAEERSFKVEDSLSATGVSSEVRGAEVAEQSMDQKTDLPDKGPNSDSIEHQIETSNISENNAKDETETDEKINSTTLSSTETKLTETDQSEKSDNLIDGKPVGLPLENENKENMETLSSSEKIIGETPENRTTYDSTLPEQATENQASFKAGEDLLDEKDKPKDVDSSLTIALKSSYIGAPCEANEDAQSNSETTEVCSREESVDPSEGVAKNEDKSSARSEGNRYENQPNGESSPSSADQPGSPNNASQSGAESSPTPAPVAAEGTSNGDPQSTYRAHVNIPEYLWSPIHQRLLGDLLFAIESDVQVWRR